MRVNGSARSNTGVCGESHSLVLHELWVLVFAGSNPVSPTNPLNSMACLRQALTQLDEGGLFAQLAQR